ncbi:MAG: leucine-rich repeat protein [Clostridia bacterium]|nr:leucine-rich repeat protein [Clostridia bacterium]
MLDNKVCNCGGTYINKKGKWVCDSCGRPMPQILDSRENQLLAVAEGKFAQEKFIEAEELYADIVKSFPSCYPAYWGLTLAKHGIKYVDDLRTGKKVATCWAPEISSIKDDKNYKKVLEIAPTAEREYYESQGEKIESIRKEWQEKAKKIKPYDVFICFKDTDDVTRGRTEDSIELSDLYNSLTRDKYNVFFSRYSLEGITAENYEPYIFQALSTAKVMIVYGSKEEYFESTWMKNEWTRFLHKIADGQKQKNSLLPVVKGCSPAALPPRLRSLQVLDAGKNTFYSDLTKYIDKVLATSEDAVELQRSKIKFDKRQGVSRGQARKIQSRALEVESVEIVSAQGEQLMKVINSFVQQKQFERAEKFCDAWIRSNPTNYRDLEELVQTILNSEHIALARKYTGYLIDNAPNRKKPQLWALMLADGYTNIGDWAEGGVCEKHVNFEYMQRVLALISQSEISVLYAYYDGIAQINTFDADVKNMILYALEFDADVKKKNAFLNALVKKAIEDTSDNFAYFEFIISLLDNARYKSALNNFVENYGNAANLSALKTVLPEAASIFLQALQKVLPLTEGKLYFRAQCAIIRILFESDLYSEGVDETQKMLGYAENEDEYSQLLADVLEFALKNITAQNLEYVDEDVFRLLGFLKDDKEDEEFYFGELAQICLDARYKKGAERYAKLLLGCSSDGKYDGYYYLMLLALDCYCDSDVARLTVDIADTEGYNNWLANCDEDQISQVTNYPMEIDELKVLQRKEYERQVAENKAQKKENKIKSRQKTLSILMAILGVISLAFSIISTIKYFASPVSTGQSDNGTGNGMLVLMLLLFPTFFTLIGAGVLRFSKDNAISDKFSLKKRKVICCVLIFPLLIANVLLYTLDIGRYKYVDDIFYVKQEFDGTQTLYEIDLSKPHESTLMVPSSIDKISATIFNKSYVDYLIIPKSVKEIEAKAFYGCKKLVIYCEAEEKPEGWDSTWNVYKDDAIWWSNNNLHYCTTYWGYKMQDEVDKDGNVIFKANGIDYKIVDGNAVVNKQSTDISGEVTVPAQVTYNGKTYTVSGMVSSAFAGCNELTEINLECSALEIPEKAFENCSSLEKINFTSTVTNIGDRAFYGCKFSSFNTSASTIGVEAFANCLNLTSFSATGTDVIINNSAFKNCRALTTVSLGNTKTVGASAFENCVSLSNITITDGVESIGAKAFAGCVKLKKVIIPLSVNNMGDSAFFGCALIDVYCRATSLPDGWNINWDNYDNSSRISVTWDYRGY